MAINFPDAPSVNDTHTVGTSTWTWDGTKWTITSTDEIDANVDDLVTLTGVAENSTTLGTFTGSTITDNQDIKDALQELETALEAKPSALNDLSDVTITAAATGEVLRYSGSAWVDTQLAYSDLSGTTNVSTFTNDANYISTAAEIRALGFFDTTNDGATSGLDADLLDGQEGTHYLARANHTGTQTLSTISDSGALAALSTVGTSEIDADSVTNTELANMAANTLKGNNTGVSADPIDLTAAQVRTLLNITASDVPFTPAGDIAATDTQAAIQELDTEKYSTTGGTISGQVAIDYTSTVNPALTLTAADDGVDAAPIIDLVRDSASPASGDYLGQIKFKGENSVSASTVYSKITGKIQDPTSGSEDGLIEFAAQTASSMTILARLTGAAGDPGLKLVNGTDLDLDTGNITLTGTVDGRDVSDDGAMLDDHESYLFSQAIAVASGSTGTTLNTITIDLAQSRTADRFLRSTLTKATKVAFSNVDLGQSTHVRVTGDFPLIFEPGTAVEGQYDGTVQNDVLIEPYSDGGANDRVRVKITPSIEGGALSAGGTIVFRQKLDGTSPETDLYSDLESAGSADTDDLYSVLSTLENYRQADGFLYLGLRFLTSTPTTGTLYVWRQRSNPIDRLTSVDNVDGYTALTDNSDLDLTVASDGVAADLTFGGLCLAVHQTDTLLSLYPGQDDATNTDMQYAPNPGRTSYAASAASPGNTFANTALASATTVEIVVNPTF